MDNLDPKLKDQHDGTEVIAKKKQELRFLGNMNRPSKEHILYALDMDKAEVYRVEVDEDTQTPVTIPSMEKHKKMDRVKATFSFLPVAQSQFPTHLKVKINPDHPVLWALNDANAVKKFKRIKFKV